MIESTAKSVNANHDMVCQNLSLTDRNVPELSSMKINNDWIDVYNGNNCTGEIYRTYSLSCPNGCTLGENVLLAYGMNPAELKRSVRVPIGWTADF